MMNKKISVIVAVYNTEKYIEKCLRSLLNQTYQNLEIIVVEDGSTDNSKKVLKKSNFFKIGSESYTIFGL